MRLPRPRTTTTKERQRAVMLALLLLLLSLLSPAARGSETLQYGTVHAESDFEVRLYGDAVWMSAPSDHTSFRVATKLGFHRDLGWSRRGPAQAQNLRDSLRKPTLTLLLRNEVLLLDIQDNH